ncbi:class I SAM-dependent methyltransferase [Synechococcus sp. CS-603]|uniref:class I SAM-dependent methyltransferase n=1 Tax=Synechococcus sp. CS-603 TaxID=2847981 RepID=UPI00223BB3E1|nr:class I SAM-dependent methyltransferase [Synechococcus sp. CS-603]MCT0201463.1 class I SAM-dependent methyltransferase [Synechococcus sp. CS-603]
MEFAQVVFYGRLGKQALSMFNLDPQQWRGARVLDCPGGPGSLSAVLRADGFDVTAVDPLYALAEDSLKQRALADLDRAMGQLAGDPAIRPGFDLAACRQEHLAALDVFLADRRANPDRYIAASLPALPFADQQFDLVLSGHLLFSYASMADGGLMPAEGLDLAWHHRALAELLRVSRRAVRLYPAHTIERQARRHPFAESLLAELPPRWSGRFASTPYDQGHDGQTEVLELHR